MIGTNIPGSSLRIVVTAAFAMIFFSESGNAVEKARSLVEVSSGNNRTTIRMEVPTKRISFDIHGTSKFFYQSDTYHLTIPRGKDDVSAGEIQLRTGYLTEKILTVGSNSKVRVVGQTSCVVEIMALNQKGEKYPLSGTYKADSCQR